MTSLAASSRKRPPYSPSISCALVAFGFLISACASDPGASVNDTAVRDPGTPTTEVEQAPVDAPYCALVDELVLTRASGGSVNAYNKQLGQVLVASPDEHEEAWRLLLEVSESDFSYERYNPAADAAEKLLTDLETTCPELPWVVIDDQGRLYVYR
jgi:hypothetical protein